MHVIEFRKTFTPCLTFWNVLGKLRKLVSMIIFIHSRNLIPAKCIFLANREITIQVNFKNELKQPRNLVPLKYWIYQRLHLATYFRNMIAKCFRISLSLYLIKYLKPWPKLTFLGFIILPISAMSMDWVFRIGKFRFFNLTRACHSSVVIRISLFFWRNIKKFGDFNFFVSSENWLADDKDQPEHA